MKKILYLLALAVAMSTGSVARAQESDGPCYDNCKRAYNACRRATPTYSCYLAYCACVAACDNAADGGVNDWTMYLY